MPPLPPNLQQHLKKIIHTAQQSLPASPTIDLFCQFLLQPHTLPTPSNINLQLSKLQTFVHQLLQTTTQLLPHDPALSSYICQQFANFCQQLTQQCLLLYNGLYDPICAIVLLNPQFRILQCNSKIQEWTNLPIQEIIGKNITQLLQHENPKHSQDLCKVLQEFEVIQDLELQLLCANQTSLPIELSAYALKQENHILGYRCILKDIRCRKAQEEKQRHHTQKLESTLKQDHQKLKIIQQNLQNLLQYSPLPLIEVNQQLNITGVSQSLEQLLEYKNHELIGQPISKLCSKESQQRIQEHYHKLNLHFYGEMELKIYTKSQKELTVKISSIPLYHADNTLSGFRSFLRNITEEKKLKHELRQKFQELNILDEIGALLQATHKLDEVLYIILVAITAGQGLAFNRAFVFLLNSQTNHLEGQLAIGPMNGQEAHKIWNGIQQANPKFIELLEAYKSSINPNSPINQLTKSLKIPHNQPHILTHVLNSQQIFVFKQNDPPSPLHNLAKEFAQTIRSHNYALVPLVAQNQSIGVIAVDNLINRLPIDEESIQLLRIFTKQVASVIESSILYKELKEKVKKLENLNQELQDSQLQLSRLERLSALGKMAAVVAHEIRTPLVSIGGFARSILKGKLSPAKQQQYLHIILEEVERLEILLNELLSYARPMEPKFDSHSINQILEKCLLMIAPKTEKYHIQLHTQLQPNLPNLWLDSSQIRQALLNILENAIQAMKPQQQGKLTIQTQLKDNYVEISIKDTGPGIEESNLDKLFRPFFTTKPKGSGLGLAIASSIFEQHQGQIQVKSRPPQGTTFLLYLPLPKQQNP